MIKKMIDDNIDISRTIPKNGFHYNIFKYLKGNLSNNKTKHIRFNFLGDFNSLVENDFMKISDMQFGLSTNKNNTLTVKISSQLKVYKD